MRSRLVMTALVTCTLAIAGCSSGRSASGLGNAKVKLIEPELQITQLSAVPVVARNVQGPMPVRYLVRVANRSAEPITLMRLAVESIGEGAYNVPLTSRPFKKTIEPDNFDTVELTINANVARQTINGANGPVTLRTRAHYDSPVGQFEQVIVSQVGMFSGNEIRPR